MLKRQKFLRDLDTENKLPTLQTSIVFKLGDDDVVESKLVPEENDNKNDVDTLGNNDVAKDGNEIANVDTRDSPNDHVWLVSVSARMTSEVQVRPTRLGDVPVLPMSGEQRRNLSNRGRAVERDILPASEHGEVIGCTENPFTSSKS